MVKRPRRMYSFGRRIRVRGSALTGGDGLARLVEVTSYVGYQGAALLEVCDSSHQDNDDEGPSGIDDSGVVVDPGDLAGFVRDANVLRHAGRDTFVEFLALENLDHLRGRRG